MSSSSKITPSAAGANGEATATNDPASGWSRVKELFAAALQTPRAARAAFLVDACAGDAALRHELETLLAAHDGAGGFLQSSNGPAAGGRRIESGTRVGPYEIVELIGAGGMGEVYGARDSRLGREVAIKMVAAGRHDESARRRFEQEARAAGRLDHPNVLQVHDVGVHEGRPYIVSELLRGHTLREELDRQQLPVRQVIDYAVQLAAGLEAAHEAGIVHRDIKPENVFITAHGRLKILDFGIAKLMDARQVATATEVQTQTGAVLGTVGYMSPEQVRGEEIDARSDIFSFGAILYEMLCRARAFAGASTVESAYAIIHQEPPRLPASLPADLERIVRSCLNKDRSRRPQSTADLVAPLSHVAALREEPRATIAARPPLRRAIITGVICVLAVVALWALIALRRPQNRPPTPMAAKPSIAVLAFADMSPGKNQEHFSDGIAEEILNALAQVDGLRVIGRTSSFSFKGKSADLRTIGRTLDVGNVLEGSIRTSGDRVRVTAQLISAADGAHLWSRTYERNMSDIFAVQDEIAASVVEALRIHLIDSQAHPNVRRTANVEAYNQYMLGRYFLNQYSTESIKRAIGASEKALAVDGDYAPAWAALSRALVATLNIGSSDFDESVARRAMTAAENAIVRDPGLSDGYTARGLVRQRLWEWEGAKTDFSHALALNDADAEAQFGMSVLHFELGHLGEATAYVQRTVANDPLSASAWNGLGIDYGYADQFELARAAFDRAIEIAPEHDLAFGNRVFLQIRIGEATAALESIRKRDPQRPFNGQTCAIAVAQHALGHEKESQAALDVMLADEKSYSPYSIAAVYAWRGDADSAFQWLDRAYAWRLRQIHGIKTDPYFRSLHRDPRFDALLRKLNLPVD